LSKIRGDRGALGHGNVEEEIDFVRQEYVPHLLKRAGLEEFPSCFVVIDIETSGKHPINSKALQFGVVKVEDGQIVESTGAYFKHPEEVTEETIGWNGITAETLEKEGIPPEELYPIIGRLLKEARDDGCIFVGHNAIRFDIPFLEYYLRAFGVPFEFGVDEVIDTGMWVKGVQLSQRPTARDTLRSFAYRIGEIHSRVKWSLDRYCILTYELDAEPDKAHDAVYDCYITCLLLKRLVGGTL